MKYENAPPSLEYALIIALRNLGSDLNDFYYDGQFAWVRGTIKVKKHRVKINVREVSDDDDNSILGDLA